MTGVALRARQAQLLAERARGSAVSVLFLIAVHGLTQAFVTDLLPVILWVLAALVMIGVTLLQPVMMASGGISEQNADQYLLVHTIISSITGAVWGVGALLLVIPDSVLSTFTTAVIVIGICLGGISPHAVYRRSYVGLATCAMVPYGIGVLLICDWPLSTGGAGVLLAFAYFLSSSAKVELGAQETLAAEYNNALMERLRQQHNALKKASEEKTRFLAAASHDLAQPLHAQGFYLAALRSGLKEDAQLELLSKIERSWRGLSSLLDGIIDVTRLDAGGITPQYRNVALLPLVCRIVDEFSLPAKQKEQVITIDGEDLTVRTDPLLLSRILRNLLSNAVKFTGTGGRIEVVLGPRGEGACLSVGDSGCGIDPVRQSEIFEEYVQLSNSERDADRGLGLGLSIVKRLADLLSIELELESRPGQGSRFDLIFPAIETVASDEASPAPVRQKSASISSVRVLILDDQEAIRSSMATLLSGWGCEVLTAASRNDLKRLFSNMSDAPDLIVTDQQLRDGQSGIGLIEDVREEFDLLIPAFIMTGDVTLTSEELDADQVEILYKPVDPAVFKHKLAALNTDGATGGDT